MVRVRNIDPNTNKNCSTLLWNSRSKVPRVNKNDAIVEEAIFDKKSEPSLMSIIEWVVDRVSMPSKVTMVNAPKLLITFTTS